MAYLPQLGFSSFFSKRPPTIMISFVCIVLLESVSLWNFPPHTVGLQYSMPPYKPATQAFLSNTLPTQSCVGPWHIKAGGVQWENKCILIISNLLHRKAVNACSSFLTMWCLFIMQYNDCITGCISCVFTFSCRLFKKCVFSMSAMNMCF